MKLGKVIHLGIVVRDVEKASAIYEKKLGIGPWEITTPADFFAKMTVNGGHDGLNIKTAMFHGDGYEIELVEPIGPGLYADWLKEKGPGLHHVKFETKDSFETVVKECEEISGRKPYLDIRWPDGRPLCTYTDIHEETGLFIEVSPGDNEKQEDHNG